MKPLFIVDLHHEVLPLWAEIRQTLPSPPAVWTLDFHTDTMPCFRGEKPAPAPGAWADRQTVRDAVRTLRHDEHIDWALRSGLIGKWELLSYALPALPPAHENMCCHTPAGFPALPSVLNSPETVRPRAESVLETDFLSAAFGAHLPGPGTPYLLDIDCDYFLCEKALHPVEGSLFDALAANAAAITVSRESDWVRLLKLRGETITGESIAQTLAERFRNPKR